MKLSDYIVNRIARLGVKHVFLVPGGGAMHLNDSVGKHEALTFVCNLHEQACAFAAEAYAKATSGLGVALVTTGPGATNAVSGTASAWVDSTPCLFLSGQVKRADLKEDRDVRQLGVQEVDIVSIVKPITKYAVTLTNPAQARYHFEKAIYLATTGRPGPVWLDIPLDVQAAEIDPEQLEGYTPPSAATEFPELNDQVRTLLSHWNRAERPVILAGGGIRLAGAKERFDELARKLGAPLLTTWVGIDLVPEEHELYAGRPGSIASRAANFAIQNSDFMLAIGARLDMATVGYAPERLARGAKKAMVDISPAEIKKLGTAIDFPICADAGAFIDEVLRQIDAVTHRDHSTWLSRCRGWKTKYPVVTSEHRGRANDVSTYLFVEALGEQLQGSETIVQGSSGIHSEIFFLAFKTKGTERILQAGGFGPMGFGVPAGIGACLATGHSTIVLDGDGSFQPNIQELQTISRLNIPLKIFVIDNRGYGSIRASQKRYFQRLTAADASSGLTLPNPCTIAAAYGIRTATISREDELVPVLREVLASPTPVVCRVMVPEDEERAPRIASYQRPDGTMESKPLEDLWPFLDRDELRAQMLIPLVEE